jgi:prevent-host-death family protein
MVMKTMAAGEFKARCLTLMDDVQRTRETVVITKRGKPVAKLVPVPAAKDDFIGRLKGKIRIVGDLDADPPEPWESAF